MAGVVQPDTGALTVEGTQHRFSRPSDAAKALTAAVSRFAAKPGTLTVQASAKSTSGLGLADVLTIADPTEIFDKIDLKANAE